MAESELYVSGIGISKNVVSTVVSLAARRVAGVASVGGNDIASSLISDVRGAVADAVTEQIGVEVAAIDVYIDSLVFPKE